MCDKKSFYKRQVETLVLRVRSTMSHLECKCSTAAGTSGIKYRKDRAIVAVTDQNHESKMQMHKSNDTVGGPRYSSIYDADFRKKGDQQRQLGRNAHKLQKPK